MKARSRAITTDERMLAAWMSGLDVRVLVRLGWVFVGLVVYSSEGDADGGLTGNWYKSLLLYTRCLEI